MKEKVFKQQLDSLISENDSLREEKGKLIYLICKLKGGGFDVHSKDERKNRDSLEDTIKSYSRLRIKDVEFFLKWAKEMDDMSF